MCDLVTCILKFNSLNSSSKMFCPVSYSRESWLPNPWEALLPEGRQQHLTFWEVLQDYRSYKMEESKHWSALIEGSQSKPD